MKQISEEELVSRAASIMGRKAGATTLRKYGKAHFSRAGKIGSASRWKNHVKKQKPNA